MDAAIPRCIPIRRWHVRIETLKVLPTFGNTAEPLPGAAFVRLFVALVAQTADIRTLVAADAIVRLAPVIVGSVAGKVTDGYGHPVANIGELQDRSGEAFAFTVSGSKCYAEVANARVGEVLAPSKIAYVPACLANVVFLYTWSLSVTRSLTLQGI